VGGPVVLDAQGKSAEGKAIWVVKGNDTTIEGITFENARVPDLNGGGIRLEGCNLTVRHSLFRGNETGILTAPRDDCSLTIENSEFDSNHMHVDAPDRQGHNIYVGRMARFVLRGSYVHGARKGHQVKSRAKETLIEYNRITDEDDSSSSYLVDIPDGGRAVILGNILQKNAKAENPSLISMGEETPSSGSQLLVVNNTLLSDYGSARFVTNRSDAPALVADNLIAGPGTVLVGKGETKGNVRLQKAPSLSDLRPKPGSPAVDAGVDAPVQPAYEYQHPMKIVPRHDDGAPDAGAYAVGG
jgi:hypothetical protein